jgi:hypothetical protein
LKMAVMSIVRMHMLAVSACMLALEVTYAFLISCTKVPLGEFRSSCSRRFEVQRHAMLERGGLDKNANALHSHERSFQIIGSFGCNSGAEARKYYNGTETIEIPSRRSVLRHFVALSSIVHAIPKPSCALTTNLGEDDIDPEEEIRALRIASELMRERAALSRPEMQTPMETDPGYPSTDVRRLRIIHSRLARLTQVMSSPRFLKWVALCRGYYLRILCDRRCLPYACRTAHHSTCIQLVQRMSAPSIS